MEELMLSSQSYKKDHSHPCIPSVLNSQNVTRRRRSILRRLIEMALNVSELCASYSDINMFENWA